MEEKLACPRCGQMSVLEKKWAMKSPTFKGTVHILLFNCQKCGKWRKAEVEEELVL